MAEAIGYLVIGLVLIIGARMIIEALFFLVSGLLRMASALGAAAIIISVCVALLQYGIDRI